MRSYYSYMDLEETTIPFPEEYLSE